MKSIDLRDLFRSVVIPLELTPAAQMILQRVIAGDEEADTYEEAVKVDRFFTRTVLSAANQSITRGDPAETISHSSVILGLDRVRDFVVSHSIARQCVPTADQDYESMDKSREILKFSKLAEERCKLIKNPYLGLAYLGGIVFDLINHKFSIVEEDTEKFAPLIRKVWRHSMMSAVFSWIISTHPKIAIAHKKNCFVTALLHDVGKLALALYSPEEYLSMFDALSGVLEELGGENQDNNFHSYEEKRFDFTHAEIGALVVWKLDLLEGLEKCVDFHHNINALKLKDSDLFLLGVVLYLSDELAKLMEYGKVPDKDQAEFILAPVKQYVPFTPRELIKISKYVRDKGLVT